LKGEKLYALLFSFYMLYYSLFILLYLCLQTKTTNEKKKKKKKKERKCKTPKIFRHQIFTGNRQRRQTFNGIEFSLAFAEDAILCIFFTNVRSKRRQKCLPTPSFPTVTTNAGITIPSAFCPPALSHFFVMSSA
jgi:hypothetical protein